MNYTENPHEFERWTRNQMQLRNAKGRILPGIGVNSSEAQLRSDQVIEQINIGRKLGATGYVLFKLDSPLVYKTLPLLGAGVNR
jgi:hypothetical protein